MAHQLGSLSAEVETLSQVGSLMEAFRAFDSDNDGCITAAELGGILGSLGYKASEQDVGAMMQQGDTNKDGLLSMAEFLEMNTKNMELGEEFAKLIKSASETLNSQCEENVTAEELYQVMGSSGLGLSLEDCQTIIASMDADRDGAISSEDLNLILSSLI